MEGRIVLIFIPAEDILELTRAGAAALLMEWILYYTGSRGADTLQLKNLLILGARQRPGEEYPNREWGYGTLDLYRTLDRLRQI